MDIFHFIRGVTIGFAIAAPVGPIGVLCIKRTLAEGRQYGLLTGLGAATADAVYGMVAAFGLTIISNFLVDQQRYLSLLGGLFLVYLGIRAMRARAGDELGVASNNLGKMEAYFSTFLLTITNPVTILAFVVIFAGLGLAEGSTGRLSGIVLVLGVFTGSTLWWLLLSTGTSLLRKRVGPRVTKWINIFSGSIIIGFGLFALYGPLRVWFLTLL